ncbi:MAG: type VI secretion system contractile sheath small subunit [Geobacter sp.]|nr:MAG: type VI secretion system contractile sheath small subunit [Geobacter sp.]
MAKELSLAPKERVNIVYRPSLGDAKEEVELPLKMLVMGDFTGNHDARPLEKREPVNVDKDNFNEVLKAQKIALNFSVPNRLAGDKTDELNVSLRAETMKDFGPEAIVAQVPELQRLLELREALRALKGPLSNVPEFRKKIQELIKDDNARQRLLAEIGLDK